MKRIAIAATVVLLGIVAGGQTIQPTGGGGTATTAGSVVNTVCGTAANPNINLGSGAAAGGMFCDSITTNNLAIFGHGSAATTPFEVGSLFVGLGSGSIYGFASTTNPLSGTIDTGIGRNAAGVVEVDNGTQGTFADLKSRSYIAGGAAPATAGSCVIGSLVGGSTAGTFTATNACGAPATAVTAVVLLLPVNAPTGWACDAQSRTASSANAVVQVASTVSAVNFRAITSTSDVIQWKCIGY